MIQTLAETSASQKYRRRHKTNIYMSFFAQVFRKITNIRSLTNYSNPDAK